MKGLIPLHHDKQSRSFFYDQETKTLIQVKHHPRALLFFLLGLFIFYNIGKIFDVNLNLQSALIWRPFVLIGWMIFMSLWIKLFYQLYFHQDSKRSIFNQQVMVKQIVREGLVQYRIERALAILSIPIVLMLSGLYILAGTFIFLFFLVFPMAFIVLFILSKPRKRRKILRETSMYVK